MSIRRTPFKTVIVQTAGQSLIRTPATGSRVIIEKAIVSNDGASATAIRGHFGSGQHANTAKVWLVGGVDVDNAIDAEIGTIDNRVAGAVNESAYVTGLTGGQTLNAIIWGYEEIPES